MDLDVDRIVRCSVDGSHVFPGAETCPACGRRELVVELFVMDEVRIADDTLTKLKRRHGEGPVKPHYEYEQRSRRWNADRNRYEQRVMVVDRERNWYVQEWRDIETDEVTWRKEGPLNDPELHGKSAHGGGKAE